MALQGDTDPPVVGRCYLYKVQRRSAAGEIRDLAGVGRIEASTRRLAVRSSVRHQCIACIQASHIISPPRLWWAAYRRVFVLDHNKHLLSCLRRRTAWSLVVCHISSIYSKHCEPAQLISESCADTSMPPATTPTDIINHVQLGMYRYTVRVVKLLNKYIFFKNNGLSILLTATDQKQQKSQKGDITHKLRRLNVNVMNKRQ